MTEKEFTEGTLTLKKEEIVVKNCLMNQAELRFYTDNPRIYSFVFAGDEELSQDEIEKRLTELDHVKQLLQSIKANGGLLDAIIVREGDNVVLEGNSRLAAYRMLCRGNPIKWGQIKCTLLPRDISEDHVFALLGEYHIIGRKDWAPYEQAGYLWRRKQKHGVPPDKMAKEMGLSVKGINHLIKVYSFMVKHHEDNPQRWSHYDEYLKSRTIDKAREYHPKMDQVVVGKISRGEIAKAVDVCDKVAKICAIKGPILNRFLKNEDSLEECYEEAIAGGADNAALKKLHSFRVFLGDMETRKGLKKMPQKQRAKCKYELKKIKGHVDSQLKSL